MNIPPPRPVPQHVPVLTEIIELNEQLPVAPAPVEAVMAPPLSTAAAVGAVAEPPPLAQPPVTDGPSPHGQQEAQMAQRVLADVQRQIDGMLEYRLREALAPILARASEALVRELRQELSKTMRDVVSRAVAQEVVRQRTR